MTRDPFLVQRADRLLRSLPGEHRLHLNKAATILGMHYLALRKAVSDGDLHLIGNKVSAEELRRYNMQEIGSAPEHSHSSQTPNSDVEPLPIIKNEDGSIDLTLLSLEQLKALGS